MSGAPTVALMVIFWCLVQLGANAAYAAITAAVPDRVPVTQRGGVGGLAAMGQTLGILTGAVFGAAFSLHAIRILLKGRFHIRKDTGFFMGLVWAFMIIMMTFFITILTKSV